MITPQSNPSLENNIYTLVREFKASKDLVFDAWTQKEHLIGWYKPEGFTLNHKKFDVKPGSGSLHSLSSPNGWTMWERHDYKEIEKPNKICYVHSFSNEQGEIISNPQMPSWPKQTIITIIFAETEIDGKKGTKVTFSWTPFNGNDEEVKAFNDSLAASTKGGWTMAFDNLQKYIEAL